MTRTPIHGVPIVPTPPRNPTDEHDAVTISQSVDDHDRIIGLERDLAEMRRRLREGASTFAALRDALEKITGQWSAELTAMEAKASATADRITGALQSQIAALKPPQMTRLQMFGVFFGAVVFVSGLIWAASRYPERGEFERLESRVTENGYILRELSRDIADARERVKDLEGRKQP